jgi:hypothetical protein
LSRQAIPSEFEKYLPPSKETTGVPGRKLDPLFRWDDRIPLDHPRPTSTAQRTAFKRKRYYMQHSKLLRKVVLIETSSI